MNQIFQALASESRRRMLDIIKDAPGCSVNDVCGFFDESRINVMKHLQVLETAGLVVSEKQGRMRRLYFNAVPIQMIVDRWMGAYSHLWAGALTSLKYHIEGSENDGTGQSRIQGLHSRKN